MGLNVGRPKPGETCDAFSVSVRGWVVPQRVEAESVEVLLGEELVHETPVELSPQIGRRDVASSPLAENSGFYAVLGALSLPPSFELLLRLKLADGTMIDLARISGTRASLAPDDPGLQPALISTPTGRTGTTWIVHLLGQHPELVAHPPFGVEPRLASYWLEVGVALSEPGSFKRTLRTQMDRPRWWLGEWSQASRDAFPDPSVERLLGRGQVLRTARFAAEQPQRFYRGLAREHGKRDPRYFVEKGPYGLRRLQLLDDMYPGLREIVVFRDPRDTVCSILSYSARRERVALVSNDPGTQTEYLETVRDSFLGLLRQTEDRPGKGLVIRYEDLVTEPAATLERILGHLGVDDSPAAVQATLDGADDRAEELASAHRTSTDTGASIGRWRTDLEPDLRARTTEIFAPVLERLGYDTALEQSATRQAAT